MPHEFESGFFTREKAWHGLGTVVENELTSRDALRVADLDWVVGQSDVVVDGNVLPNYKANVRMSDNSVLGIVSNKYQIVQNVEAFDFTDRLLGEGVRYETAGSLKSGKTVWLLAKMEGRHILGDAVDPYLCFMNTHDGTGAVRVCTTPVRVVCNNTLNLALQRASRTWATRHMGNLEEKLREAERTLLNADRYMNALNDEAEHLATQHISRQQVDEILDDLFNKDDADTERKLNNVNDAKEAFYMCYLAPDLANFINTQYGVVNAMADMVDHKIPARESQNYKENNFARIINGHALLDKLYEKLKVTV